MTDTNPINKIKRLLIVSGRSGSGKSTALRMLEDEGFTCIDNLPVKLLHPMLQQVRAQEQEDRQKFAIGIDARNPDGDLKQLVNLLSPQQLPDVDCTVVYLDTSREVLLKRFSETRRRHPLSDEHTGLNEAIAKEKALLEPIADIADITMDTTSLTVHDLRSAIKRQVVGREEREGVAIMFQSFGFKYGSPTDIDFMFDVRCLPNPYWDPELRKYSGLDTAVIEFLDEEEQVQKMYRDIKRFILEWGPSFDDNNRSYMTIAIGCTGGKHRSVYLCEKLAKKLRETFGNVQTRHRQLNPLSS